MGCERVDLGNGTFAVVCGRGHKAAPPCQFCGCASSKLCDFPVRKVVISSGRQILKARSCDAPMCEVCATSIGADRDLCPPHAREWGAKAKAVGA